MSIHHWFRPLLQQLADSSLTTWLETLPSQLAHWQRYGQHGEFKKWENLLNQLPVLEASQHALSDVVSVGLPADANEGQRAQLVHMLQKLKPWRKGPFNLFGVDIDTEWRSDFKWNRLLPHIAPLANRHVLDVGCGSGYHLWRMREQGCKMAVGVDPSDLFLCQFRAIQHYLQDPQTHLVPLGIDDLGDLPIWDTVFSMGVLYHRRSPIDFISQLAKLLRPGGELVLETLVINGDKHSVLVPEGRYAQMRNVWFIPSVDALILWCQRAGLKNVRCVDVDTTTLLEQRKTDWIDGQSLDTFLDPHDPAKTVEGHPAPKRAVILAEA